MNSHCCAITCTCSFGPDGTAIGLGPWPPPAPFWRSSYVPKPARKSTTTAEIPTQRNWTVLWLRSGGPSTISPPRALRNCDSA